jgi:succinate dehydrogenase/fumarate reductase flavoprotein subunit
VNEVTDRVLELEEIGLHFKKQEGGQKFYQEKRLGSSYARSLPPIGGSVGMLGTLRKEVLNREVEVHQWTMITKLFNDGDRASGAVGVNIQTGELSLYRAKAIVLAAGSAIALEKYTSANFLTTGDAYTAAFEAGAKLANLEFLEFTLVPAPGGLTIPMAGLSPFTSKGGRFFNALGERFLEKYDPERLETTTRALIVTSTYKEMLEGRGPIYMDPSFIPDEKWDMEMTYEYAPKLAKAGVDCRNDKFNWVPALHTFLGGVLVDDHCAADGVQGLYASGESSTGTHGANRLSGNAIASCLVMGARSGKFATQFASANDYGAVDEGALEQEIDRLGSFKGDGGLDPFGVEAEIKNIAWENVGVLRNASGLARGIERFMEIRREKIPRTRGKDIRGWIKALECANLARVGEMVARSASERTETRGQHSREDYPRRDDQNWLKWVQVYKDGEEIRCTAEPIPFKADDLRPK